MPEIDIQWYFDDEKNIMIYSSVGFGDEFKEQFNNMVDEIQKGINTNNHEERLLIRVNLLRSYYLLELQSSKLWDTLLDLIHRELPRGDISGLGFCS